MNSGGYEGKDGIDGCHSNKGSAIHTFTIMDRSFRKKLISNTGLANILGQ